MDGFAFLKAPWTCISMKACLLVCCVILVNGYVINQQDNVQLAQPAMETYQNDGNQFTEGLTQPQYANNIEASNSKPITPDFLLMTMKSLLGSGDQFGYQSKELMDNLKKYPQFDDKLNDKEKSPYQQNSSPQFNNQFNNNPQFTDLFNYNQQFTNQMNSNPQFTNQMNSNPQFTDQMNSNSQFTNQMNTGRQQEYQQMFQQQMFPNSNMEQQFSNMQEEYYNGQGSQMYEAEEEEGRAEKVYKFVKKWGYYLWVVWPLIEGWGLIKV